MWKRLVKWFLRIPSDDILHQIATDLTDKALYNEQTHIEKYGEISPEKRETIFAESVIAWRKWRKYKTILSEDIFPAKLTKGVLYTNAELVDKIKNGHIKYGYGVYQISLTETTMLNIYVQDVVNNLYRKDMPFIRWVQY